MRNNVPKYEPYPIEQIGLPKRISNALLRANITSLEEVKALTKKEMAKLPSIGSKTIEEILRANV